ncbi:MAG: diguanylate cyclase [Candidatus Brocadiia bacterium]
MDEEKISVLLIEESGEDAELVMGMLAGPAGSPFELEHASDLDAGLDRIEGSGCDVILLGLSAPGALAIKDVEKVRRGAEGTPIIVLSSLDETRVVLDTAREGATDYLVKSRMSPRELSRAIRYAVERTRIRRARRQAEASLRQVVDSSADAMVVVDEQGVVQFVNPAAVELFQRKADQFVGEQFHLPLEPDEVREVTIPGAGGQEAVAQMRVVESVWEGKPAYVATLRDITEIAGMREKLRELSLHDELTGLYNRRGFVALAEQQLKLADREEGAVLLLFADLDGLKAINDQFGHQAGDKALQDVARVLKKTFRKSDILARVGGDEFAVLAFGAGKKDADTVAQRLQEALNERLAREEDAYELSLSVGVAYRGPKGDETIEDLIATADELMYEHKRRR